MPISHLHSYQLPSLPTLSTDSPFSYSKLLSQTLTSLSLTTHPSLSTHTHPSHFSHSLSVSLSPFPRFPTHPSLSLSLSTYKQTPLTPFFHLSIPLSSHTLYLPISHNNLSSDTNLPLSNLCSPYSPTLIPLSHINPFHTPHSLSHTHRSLPTLIHTLSPQLPHTSFSPTPNPLSPHSHSSHTHLLCLLFPTLLSYPIVKVW